MHANFRSYLAIYSSCDALVRWIGKITSFSSISFINKQDGIIIAGVIADFIWWSRKLFNSSISGYLSPVLGPCDHSSQTLMVDDSSLYMVQKTANTQKYIAWAHSCRILQANRNMTTFSQIFGFLAKFDFFWKNMVKFDLV